MRVFVSYRRDDSKHSAARLAASLSNDPQIKSVFLDIEDIAAGESFPNRLETALSQSDVCLVLIGQDWVGRSEPGVQARISTSGDYVRMEVARALAEGKRVIPVILDNAAIPSRTDLPEDIQPLLDLNASFLRHQSFNQDIEILIDALHGRKAGPRKRRRPVMQAMVKTAGGLGLGIFLFVLAAALNLAISGQNLETTLGGLPMFFVVGLTCLAIGLAASFGVFRNFRRS